MRFGAHERKRHVGYRFKGCKKVLRERNRRIQEALEIVQLEDYAIDYRHKLRWGQPSSVWHLREVW